MSKPGRGRCRSRATRRRRAQSRSWQASAPCMAHRWAPPPDRRPGGPGANLLIATLGLLPSPSVFLAGSKRMASQPRRQMAATKLGLIALFLGTFAAIASTSPFRRRHKKALDLPLTDVALLAAA